jgi:flagellar motility protein MotE (MotC chaperone)
MSSARKPQPKRTSVATVIALLLVTSALVRLGGGIGAAIAREVGTLSATDTAATSSAICTGEAEVGRLLDTLRGRESDVAAREQQAMQTEAQLDLAKQRIASQIAELQAAETQLSQTMALAEKAAETDLTQLTSVYQSMKPKEAAAVFEQMAPAFAAGFLGRMTSAAAANIFAGLQPETAYAISVILAGRNLDAPTQ